MASLAVADPKQTDASRWTQTTDSQREFPFLNMSGGVYGGGELVLWFCEVE